MAFKIYLDNNTFTNLITTGKDGGAIYLSNPFNSIIQNNNFLNNNATAGSGGAITIKYTTSNSFI